MWRITNVFRIQIRQFRSFQIRSLVLTEKYAIVLESTSSMREFWRDHLQMPSWNKLLFAKKPREWAWRSRIEEPFRIVFLKKKFLLKNSLYFEITLDNLTFSLENIFTIKNVGCPYPEEVLNVPVVVSRQVFALQQVPYGVKPLLCHLNSFMNIPISSNKYINQKCCYRSHKKHGGFRQTKTTKLIRWSKWILQRRQDEECIKFIHMASGIDSNLFITYPDPWIQSLQYSVPILTQNYKLVKSSIMW